MVAATTTPGDGAMATMATPVSFDRILALVEREDPAACRRLARLARHINTSVAPARNDVARAPCAAAPAAPPKGAHRRDAAANLSLHRRLEAWVPLVRALRHRKHVDFPLLNPTNSTSHYSASVTATAIVAAANDDLKNRSDDDDDNNSSRDDDDNSSGDDDDDDSGGRRRSEDSPSAAENQDGHRNGAQTSLHELLQLAGLAPATQAGVPARGSRRSDNKGIARGRGDDQSRSDDDDDANSNDDDNDDDHSASEAEQTDERPPPTSDDDDDKEKTYYVDRVRSRAACFYEQIRRHHAARIKSRSYRRVRRLERERSMPTLDELAEVSPEAYADQLRRMERLRVKERILQKHGHRTAWAKYALRSKDPILQRAVHEQLKQRQMLLEKRAESPEANDEGDAAAIDDDTPTTAYPRLMALPFMQRAAGTASRPPSGGATDEVPATGGRRTFPLSGGGPVAGAVASSSSSTAPSSSSVSDGPVPGPVLVVALERNGKADAGREADPSKDDIVSTAGTEPSPDAEAMIREAFAEGDDGDGSTACFGASSLADIAAEKAHAAEDAVTIDPDCEATAGWNEWIGHGTRPSRRRLHELEAAKAARAAAVDAELSARPDHKLRHVVLNRRTPQCTAKYRALDLPVGVRNEAVYEAELRKPLGREWNSAQQYRLRTRPKVRVQPGCSIAPLMMAPEDRDVLLPSAGRGE